MRISLEAETLPLFVGGVVLVVLLELVFALLALRKRPQAKRAMVGHVVCMALAFFFLGLLIFWGRPAPDGGAVDGSGRLALFGIFWFLGECCGLWALAAPPGGE